MQLVIFEDTHNGQYVEDPYWTLALLHRNVLERHIAAADAATLNTRQGDSTKRILEQLESKKNIPYTILVSMRKASFMESYSLQNTTTYTITSVNPIN